MEYVYYLTLAAIIIAGVGVVYYQLMKVIMLVLLRVTRPVESFIAEQIIKRSTK